MFKKSLVAGLVLLIVGGAVLGWLLAEQKRQSELADLYKSKYETDFDEYLNRYNEWLELNPEERAKSGWKPDSYTKSKSPTEFRREQRERLQADIDKLASGEMVISPFADILYGSGWQNKVSEYQKQKESRELVLISSIVCIAVGGGIVGCLLLLLAAKLLVRGSVFLFERLRQLIGKHYGKMGKTKVGSKSKGLNEVSVRLSERENWERENSTSAMHSWDSSRDNKEKMAMLFCDECSVDFDESPEFNGVVGGRQFKPFKHVAEAACQTGLLEAGENTAELEEVLKIQDESLERHVEEFKHMAQTLHRAALEHSEPLRAGLKELTQQVSAIREYASCQQSRMEKLQEGYDWNIIRTFCLRVIRCIDNIETRIRRLSKDGIDTTDMEEVRDELVFSLESSGVEQFEPEINSDYRGQERCAEAVKDKARSSEPGKAGKIAKVLRPGYQYIIDEENIKVVRPARVKLFG